MNKRILIVGNWKMHLNTSQASLLLHRLQERIRISRDIEVVLAPSTLVLQPLSVQLDRRKFRLAAQNAYQVDEGAFTGEVSFTMLRDLVHYVIVGHSERRIYFKEDLPMVRDKVTACVRNEITPILCVGETRAERRQGMTKQVIHDQVVSALQGLTAAEVGGMVIAYEPVWAIGTHVPAKPYQIEEDVQLIRWQVEQLYGVRIARQLRILYGASVEPEFTKAILQLEGVDGLLVGGASINYHMFSAIVNAAYVLHRERETAP